MAEWSRYEGKSAFGPTGEYPKTDTDPRCRECGKMLARLLTRPWVIMCPRCKTNNAGLMPGQEFDSIASPKAG
jgi:phage FluMu protein Com